MVVVPRLRRPRSLPFARLLSLACFLRLGALLALLAACAPVSPPERSPTARLLVANALDGTVTLIDPERAAVSGPDLPTSPSPWQVAPGPAGSLVVLSSAVEEIGRLAHVTPPAHPGAAWPSHNPVHAQHLQQIKHIQVGLRLRSAYLAADGVRYAVLAYSQPALPAPLSQSTLPSQASDSSSPQSAFCGLEVVDLTAARVVGTHGVCAAGRETVTGLALTSAPTGLIAVVGVAHAPTESARRADGLGNRLVAVDVRTGHVLASAFVAGSPSNLLFAPHAASAAMDPAGSLTAPTGSHFSLYCLLSPADVTGESRPERATLQVLDPDTLASRRQLPLSLFPRRLVVSPDGGSAYALNAAGTALLHVDLASGAHRHLASLPGTATDLALAAGGLFAPHAYGAAVWRFDPLTGALTHTIPTGRHPTTVALSSLPWGV